MNTRISGPVRSASLCLLTATLLADCQHKNDAISQAEKADKINGVAAPSIDQTKAIAQEGFIYGLPLVMYYTSAYELFVDPTSSQYKAPAGKLYWPKETPPSILPPGKGTWQPPGIVATS